MKKDEIRYKDIIAMYEEGKTYQSIGKKYNISRQRVCQIIKPLYETLDLSKRRSYDIGNEIKPNPSELYLYGKLKYLKLKFKIQPLQSYFDVLIKKYKVEIKYRSKPTPLYINDSKYKGYCFNFLKNRHNVDFYIFICGDLKKHPNCYIYPSSLIKNSLTIPVNMKYKKTRQKYLKHLDNWKVFK